MFLLHSVLVPTQFPFHMYPDRELIEHENDNPKITSSDQQIPKIISLSMNTLHSLVIFLN